MTTITQEFATEGQVKQIGRVAADAAENAVKSFPMSKRGAQKVHTNGGKFKEAVEDAVISVLQSLMTPNKYKSEEVKSSYGYLSGYRKLKSLTEQAEILVRIFPGLCLEMNLAIRDAIESGEIATPADMEGAFVVPNWRKRPDIFGSSYATSVLKTFEVIKATRGSFYNYRDGQINDQRIQITDEFESFLSALIEDQTNPDLLIFFGQFGLNHAGRSVRRVLEVMEDAPGEVGNDAFFTGSMVLTHDRRLADLNDLWIDCPGTKFDDPGSSVRFDRAPSFRFSGGEVEFDAKVVSCADARYGSSSVRSLR